MKFKVGDVCEIVLDESISQYWRSSHGAIVTIVALAKPACGHNYYLTDLFHGGRRDVEVREDLLRLKRPPSWSQWIYDVSQIEHENKQPVSV